MQVRSLGLLSCGLIVGLIGGLIVSSLFAMPRNAAPPPPPLVAGQEAPNRALEIDFSKRYDLSCHLFGEELDVYRSCKIVGYVNHDKAEQNSGYSSSRGKFYQHFNEWLVIQTPDERLVYIPASSIKYFEEAKVMAEAAGQKNE